MASIVNSVCEIIRLMSEKKVERIQITYEIGDIIEQKCRRCYYNRSEKECFSISVCNNCPTGEELRQLGRYLDTQQKNRGGKRKDVLE
ncbi:zinc-finger domain-containing protein [Bacillus sp. SH5-2]|nr:zinc-finger domain-containing protein [Bacillus sp. SH5-2]